VNQMAKADSAGHLYRAKALIFSTVACVCFMQGSAMAFAQQAPVPPPAAQHVQHPNTELPPGQGRDTTLRVCSKCHSPNILIANPRDRQGWEDTITKMSGLGATATDDEFTEILEYLVKNVSPQATAKVNLNKSSSADLQTSLELSPKDADAVVAYRTKNGDFKTLDDLKKVPDLDLKKIDDKKDRLIF
jgi:competence protein ComEA